MSTLSVILPNYNHAKYISDSIRSIREQSRQPEEVLIIDDGSTDDSMKVIKECVEGYPVVRIIKHEDNRGLINVLRGALENVGGDYVHFLAADDRLLPDFYEKSMRMLNKYPQSALCTSGTFIINEDGIRQNEIHLPPFRSHAFFMPPIDIKKYLQKNNLGFNGNSTVYRRDFIQEIGGFQEELGPYCDSILALVMASKHGACFIRDCLAEWRIIEGSYSQKLMADPNRFQSTLRSVQSYLSRENIRSYFTDHFVRKWRHREAIKALRIFYENPEKYDQAIAFTKVENSFNLIEKNILKLIFKSKISDFSARLFIFLLIPWGEQRRILLLKIRNLIK